MPTYSKTSSWLFKLRRAQRGWIGGNKPLSSARSKAAASQVSCVVGMLDFVWITDCNKRLEEPVCLVWGLLAVENGPRWAPAPHSLQPRIHLETSVPLHRLRHATLDRGRSGQLMTANSKVSTEGAFLSNPGLDTQLNSAEGQAIYQVLCYFPKERGTTKHSWFRNHSTPKAIGWTGLCALFFESLSSK